MLRRLAKSVPKLCILALGTHMTATKQSVSFEEYLTFQARQDIPYELEDGMLIPIPVGRSQHTDIARFLEDSFREEIKRLGLPLDTYRGGVGVRVP